MRRSTPADLVLVVSLVYAAGMALVCLIATMAGADALDDWERLEDRREQAQERSRDEYEARVEAGQRQYDRMLEEQERQAQEQYRREQRSRLP